MNAKNTMNALPMSKAETRKHYVQKDGKPFDKLVIGAIIPHQISGEVRTILLLKRAAHEMYFPNHFEVPGGNIEESDRTIADAVKREVLEETGMNVLDVIRAVTPFAYSMKKTITDADGEESSLWKTSLQLNFICEVIESEIAINQMSIRSVF